MSSEQFARITLSGKDLLRRLLELEAFRVCPPLETNAFLRYSEKNGRKLEVDLLEQFEKRGFLTPFFRVRFPVAEEKLQPLEDGGLQNCGRLAEGETWSGPTRKSYVWPNPEYHDLRAWLEEGYIYSPNDREFEPWETFRDENNRLAIGSYFSIFQVYTLRFQAKVTTLLLNATFLANYAEEDFADLKNWAESTLQSHPPCENPRYDAVVLAQAISSRYYPSACTDLRTITTPGLWDWQSYARSWRADEVVAGLGISTKEVRRLYELLDTAIFWDDPLEDWDDLLTFVSRSRKEKLKGDAQYGQTLRSMRDMFGLLFKDLTGEEIQPRKGTLAERYALNDGSRFARKLEDRRAKASRDVEFLEFVANRYGLNPRPALVLFVEGDGEETVFPLLVERFFDLSLATCGVEIRNLRGIAGFTGSRKDRYGALEKVIEELHLSQTVVFVVLDNEGRGLQQTREKLSTARSKYFPKRTVIRREFIHIWKESIELDNFTHHEIAAALTAVSEGRYEFAETEVAIAAASFGKKRDPISGLFQSKLQYELPKLACLKILMERLSRSEEVSDSRPILVLLDQILEIAALNHKPTFVDLWFENQESGYLGHPVDGDDEMADAFQILKRLQAHLDVMDS